MPRRWAGLGLSGLLFLAQACGDSTGTPDPERVVVNPPNATLEALGETVQFSARLLDRKGNEIPEPTFVWTTTNGEIASISASGLVTGLKAGAVSVRASAEGISGGASLYVDPVPDQVTKVAGDEQGGSMREVLPIQPTVAVLDANGNPISGKYVVFSVAAGGGLVSPAQVRTGEDGTAAATWALGCSNDNPQKLNATIGGLTVTFSATVDLEALAICQDEVPSGRATQAYSTNLEAAGGDQSSLTWSIVDGSLPPGLDLSSNGTLSGTPILDGDYLFRAQVQDGAGSLASSLYQLTVCEAPLDLSPGDGVVLDLPGADDCGFFLPSGTSGDRYRFGVVYANPLDQPSDAPNLVVQMVREIGGLPSSQALFNAPAWRASGGESDAGDSPRISANLDEVTRVERATEALHHRIRLAEQRLLEELGPNARPLPDTRRLVAAADGAPPSQASPEKTWFTNPKDFTCEVGETVRAIKIRENDVMVVYQDSIQWNSDPLTTSQARSLLDYYEANGPPIIDTYFGGTTDINGDGKLVLFVSPVVESGTVAFVWAGDFFPKVDQGLWAGCPASNAMEMMRFSLSSIQNIDSGNYQAVGTTVHEAKHISSLYNSIIRDDYQPLWVEEGTAEIAKEASSRLAWAGAGGPPVGAMAEASDVTEFNPENYGVVLPLAGTVRYLSSQPNGVVTTPDGAAEGHSVYGSGWHFHRWLGDAYGNAAQPGAEAAFFRSLNDSLTAAGYQGVLEVTGAPSWSVLMEEYVQAIMLNGFQVPQGPRRFTTYDFPSITSVFSSPNPVGDYPWSVNGVGETNTAVFASDLDTGPMGPSGVRIFDVTSDGTGLGLDVKVSAIGGTNPFRIAVVRVQ